MLLYLVKHSRPDLSNCTRELSKVMDGVTTIQWNELLHVIKYAIGKKETGLQMDLTNDEKWHLRAFSDADFAGDKDKRISVTGYIVLFQGYPSMLEVKGSTRSHTVNNRS